MSLTREAITLNDKTEIECITLKNNKNMSVEILTLGGILKSINVPDKNNIVENILLEYQDINTYIENPGYINALIGRTAGRIHKGTFTLKETSYKVTSNQLENTLHGGAIGLDKKVWSAKDISHNHTTALELTCTSPDGEEGYPGNLDIKVTYSLSEDNALTITYEALSDKDTLVNLTNHAYFNLSGNAKRDILTQILTIKGDAICELDEESIPTGTLLQVKKHSAFDFTAPKPIGQDILVEDPQLKLTLGYDHPWLLNGDRVDVTLYDALSGRKMDVSTNQKAVVVYTMNYENPSLFTNGKENLVRYGICFETQALPIGYNECFKEDCILVAHEKYTHCTTFKFDVLG